MSEPSTDEREALAEATINTTALRAIALSDPQDTARTGALSAMALLAADDLDAARAVLAARPAVDVEAIAEAWDRGYTSGHSRAMRKMSDEPNVEPGVNPYRLAGEGR